MKNKYVFAALLVVFLLVAVSCVSTEKTSGNPVGPAYPVSHLAVGKPAVQSSTEGGAARIGTAELAVDGNRDGKWESASFTHTAKEANAWWQVDLGESMDIGNIVVWNRTGWTASQESLTDTVRACCMAGLQDYWVLVSDQPFTSTDLNVARKQSGVTGQWVEATGTKSTVTFDRTARFVRVQLAGTGILSIAEVEVQAPGVSQPQANHRNRALGATSSQSSVQDDADSTRAQDGSVDGVFANGSIIRTKSEKNPWWQADLRDTVRVSTVKVWNRSDPESAPDLYVLTSTKLFDSTDLTQTLAQPGVVSKRIDALDRVESVTINADARYVRVQSARTDALSLAEVEIFDDGPGPSRPDAAAQARELDFGMFIHYGMGTYTDQEWATPGTPTSKFAPTKVDTDQWAAVAKSAGMKYGVLTTKHHDGFALWDTASNKYDVATSKYRKDVVREFADSFRAQGLNVGLYYSICDRTSGESQLLIANQLRELLTNYGYIDQLWFDCFGWETSYGKIDSERILDFIRNVSPGTTVNNNDHYDYLGATDIISFEWSVPPAGRKNPTQRGSTLGKTWFNQTGQTPREAAEILSTLKRMRAAGYQYLLNVGPGKDGRIPDAFVARLAEIGAGGGILR